MTAHQTISPSKWALQAFTGFARAQSSAWRFRRVDRFEPRDFHLASHRVTLQGRFGPSLVSRFQDTFRDALPELDHWEVAPGVRLRMVLPAITQPKRFLLHSYAARHPTGEVLPLLTKLEGARFSALYLWSILRRQTDGTRLQVAEEQIVPTIRLLAALAHQNANAMSQRARRWATETDTLFQAGHEAFRAQLLEWARHEANSIAPGCGDALLPELTDLHLPVVKIPRSARPGALAPYRTLNDLLLASIRDVILMVLDTTPQWRKRDDGTDTFPREHLASNPNQLATQTADVFRTGIPALAGLILNQASDAANRELANHLERWVAYVPTVVEIGQTFLITFEQALPLGPDVLGRREFLEAAGQTYQEYPLAMRDAASVHAEIVLNDPDLRIGLRRGVVSYTNKTVRVGRTYEYAWHRRRLSRRAVSEIVLMEDIPGRASIPLPIHEQFDLVERIGEQELALWAARGVGAAPRLSLRVPLNLSHSVFVAYLFACLFFISSATFVAGAWVTAAVESKPLYHPEAVFAINALGVTLSLWMTATQHTRQLVHKKLLMARWIFFASMLAFVAGPAFFVCWWFATTRL